MKRNQSSWIPELDGLRALMIFLVSWYHIWQQSWLTPRIGTFSLDFLMRSGYVWVDGTVLLSAFLLFLPYARSRLEGTPVPDTRDFYFRRARRILPGYYFILLLVFFAVALPWDLYRSPHFMVKDLATHFTFSFTFFEDTYISTPLGAACWTLAIEVQAYLIFPLLARAAMRRPVLTTVGMAAICFGFRLWCIWSLGEFNMVVNQLINFLDVYALGIGMAFLFLRLKNSPSARRWPARLLATGLFLAAGYGLYHMLNLQARSSTATADFNFAGWLSEILDNSGFENNYAVIQRNQMVYRPAFALLFGTWILSAPFAFLPLRALLGNPVTRFLSGISMNYYLIHQTIIVHMRRIGFPPSENDLPNQAGEQPWQTQYVLWSFGLSLLAAVLITYLVEKPAAALINRLRERKR